MSLTDETSAPVTIGFYLSRLRRTEMAAVLMIARNPAVGDHLRLFLVDAVGAEMDRRDDPRIEATLPTITLTTLTNAELADVLTDAATLASGGRAIGAAVRTFVAHVLGVVAGVAAERLRAVSS